MDEKFSLISELIKMAKVDGKIKLEEYDFLLTLCKILDISKTEFNNLLDDEKSFQAPGNENERIVQFYRLVLLANIDLDVNIEELNHLKKAGLRLGLNLYAIDTVLEEMKKHKNGKIPTKRLIEIFRVNLN